MIKYITFIFLTYIFYIISTFIISKITVMEIGDNPKNFSLTILFKATFTAFAVFILPTMFLYKALFM